ncbi:hypothetical protein PIB30_038486 [Stylosanthes scabra]|uniref:Uncharacterized protein n=1 Tax=Stylosanthes scabra TaxID=79078 RepID=A0ABU6QEJ9_9FABA|nr:hypothetical protein [Stylosanthes scabra]
MKSMTRNTVTYVLTILIIGVIIIIYSANLNLDGGFGRAPPPPPRRKGNNIILKDEWPPSYHNRELIHCLHECEILFGTHYDQQDMKICVEDCKFLYPPTFH